MRKRRQPNSAGFLAPASVKPVVEVAPAVEVEPAVETVVEPEPAVVEPVVTETEPQVAEEPETNEPVTLKSTKVEDDTTDEVAF